MALQIRIFAAKLSLTLASCRASSKKPSGSEPFALVADPLAGALLVADGVADGLAAAAAGLPVEGDPM